MYVWRGEWSELLKFLRWLWLEKNYRVGLYIPSLLDQQLVIKLRNIKFHYDIGVSKRGTEMKRWLRESKYTLVKSKRQECQNDEGYRENGREIVGLYPPEQQGTQASDVGPHSLWLTCQSNSTSMQILTASRTSLLPSLTYTTLNNRHASPWFLYFFHL